MASQIWVVLFQFSIFTQLVYLTIAQDDFWYHFCIDNGNYTQSSAYRQNLDDVLFSLTRTNNGYGFFNSSAGEAEAVDTANALALCKGDIGPDDCARCVDDATRELRRLCPDQREAAGWYDNCLLSYSNSNLLYTVNKDLLVTQWNINNVSDWVQFDQSLGDLFGRLRREAAKGGSLRKYAVGNTTEPTYSTLYGLMQCTPDLSEAQCDQCLAYATQYIALKRRIGGKVYGPSCKLRYELNIFYNETWYPPPSSPPSPPPSPSPSPLPPPPPSSPSAPPERKRKTSTALVVGPALAASAVAFLIFFFICLKISRKGKGEDFLLESSIHSPEGSKNQREEDDAGEMNYYNLTTIQAATNNFSLANKLGEGGFGPVYWGKLDDGKEIAVKRLSKNSGQGLEEFKTEVKLIIKLQHKNLVRLLGCCIKGNERLLVYEYMANTSVDAFLFNPTRCKELGWAKHANIVSGIAKGLRYLHEDSRLKIIHRDMKAGNVLLDDEMNPKISDFGTARIFGVDQMEANTCRVVGTYGYMAPEYAMDGLFSTQSDVYSFGVLLLEIVSGQRNGGFYHQDHAQNFLSYAWRLWKEGKGEQLIDQNLIGNCPVSEALRWINVALLCVQVDPKDRPIMSSVVFMLEGQSTTLPKPPERPFSFGRLFTSNSLQQLVLALEFPRLIMKIQQVHLAC